MFKTGALSESEVEEALEEATSRDDLLGTEDCFRAGESAWYADREQRNDKNHKTGH